ncbi:TonB-dependent receptor [uncultured Sphingomonas sp.]|uniref:TonB-dependent receptor n=1 Tax=uncultured Sphingomonas sp. TaxID=158754 RepID=UPI002626BEA9|nr:TonB-dependent receptor [uncultured Sphingomonas sp.]
MALVLVTPLAAAAQSTGTVDAENEIVVEGSRSPRDVNGIELPDTPKAKAVLTQELIERRTPGQSILDTINLVPGVNFTNSDPYGSSGGNLRIRGFDGNRVSLTFDGIPLNDSGNYAIYSNQQLDPELIEQVNVNFGATDVDSPTASASGGTVNYRSLIPSEKLGAIVDYSHGSFDMNRVFGLINTGVFTTFGTKAWVSASEQRYDQYRGSGEIYKQQFNAKIYQPLGSNGDFISVAAHYNQNRNNSYSNPTLANIRTVLGTGVVPSSGVSADTPYTLDLNKAQYDAVFGDTSSSYLYDASCALPSASGVSGTSQNDRTACGNVAATAINPSNTGNFRVNARKTLSDRLTFTFDGAYTFTRANGGGSTVLAESDGSATNASGTAAATDVYTYQLQRLGAGVASAVDLSGDGDTLDYVRVYFPSNTRTQRFTAIAGLRYELDASNAVRVAYTWDRARHRQTGEASLLDATGTPYNVFSALDGEGDYAVLDAAGNVVNKRNRLSYAILHQVSGEYRGSFFEDRLKVALGVRAPFFRRNLTNYCYTIPGNSSDAYCTSQTAAQVAANATTASYGAPYANRIKTYNAVLPNVGLTYQFVPHLSMFTSYAKGFSAPRTDNLYAFDDVTIVPTSAVKPEKTDSFDLGLRYSSRLVQAQVAGWYIHYTNRIVSTTTTLEGGGTLTTDRNVGTVESKGVDANIGITPNKHLSLYGFASYADARLQDDVLDANGAVLLATAGKFVVETPKWQYGGRAQVELDPFSLGVQVKHVGRRYVTDVNDLLVAGYTTVDLDARASLARFGLENTFLQLNVTNLFEERYFGNLSTATSASGTTRYTFGAPRTVIGSIHFAF